MILACTLFAPVTAHAETNEISIQSVTLSSTEGNAEEINPATTDGKKISLDIKLYDPGDSVTYTVEIKNNTDSNFYIDDESAKTTTDYLEYVFDYGNTRAIAAGQSRGIKLIVTYKNKVPADQLENDQRIELDSLSLDFFEEGEILVPDTIDITLVIYSVIVVVSAAVLYKLFKAKKIFVCLILAICAVAIIPAKANAERECSIDVEARVTIDGKEAYFLPGMEANAKMKEIAGTDISTDGYKTLDTNILAIKKSDTEPSPENKTTDHVVSTNESSYPIYMWFDNGDLYWWSEDQTPDLNEDARFMFRNMIGMLDISGVADFDSSNTTNMRGTFAGNIANHMNMNISSLKPLSKWDTSSVVSLQGIFQGQDGLVSLEGLENWDVSNVETLYLAFSAMSNLTSLKALTVWNTAKVKDIAFAFGDDPLLTTLEGLENWDTSNVETMQGTFLASSSASFFGGLESLEAIKNWDTSKVTTMRGMLQKQAAITSLDALKKWDVSNVTNFANFCSNCISLSDARAANNWDMASVTIFDRMFNDTPALKEINLSNFDFSQVATTANANLISNNPNLERLKTPKIYPTDSAVKITLPVTMYDADGNAYTQLDNTSPTEIWLTSTAP